MRVNEILREYRDADLYHGTSLASAEKILMTNRIEARGTAAITLPKRIHNDAENWPTTVSFSRSLGLAMEFAKSKSFRAQRRAASYPDSAEGVVFVIDQAKLHRDHGKRLRPHNDLQFTSKHRIAELEELFVGDIENIKNYIKKIYVFVPTEEAKDELEITDKVVMNHPLTKVIVNQGRNNDNRPMGAGFPTQKQLTKTHNV